ncbi:hypothetical protein KKE03_03045 [Patescibacteria group bacterium]|nr:hypothetical protein [Patescibacteria group bacterium]
MSKKSLAILLILSVVATYGAAFVEGLAGDHFLAYGGIPFRFASGSFLGGSTDNLMLIIDIAFWFVVIWVIWSVLRKVTSGK